MNEEAITLRDTAERLRDGVDEVTRLVGEIPRTVDDLLRELTLPPAVVAFIVRTATQVVETVGSVLDHLHQLLTGAAAPVWFFDLAGRWQDVRGTVSRAASALEPDLMPAAGTWHGDAAAAYARAARPQRGAAERITTLSSAVSDALTTCGEAGSAFYAALAVAVVTLTIELLAALFTMLTGIGIPVALTAAIGATTTQVFFIAAALTALVNLLVKQAQQTASLHGDAVDDSTFPGGHWPDPITRTYSDATVTDGDADWSLRN